MAASESDKELLAQLLRHKLDKVPAKLMPDISVDEIIQATHEQGGKFPFDDDANVPLCATLQGILEHRANHAYYARKEIPLRQCDPEALLAYFISNYDSNMSFNTYYRETRLRCYLAFNDKQKRKATQVQMTYLYACLEEMGHKTFYNPQSPCAARADFILALIRKPKDFKVFKERTAKMLLDKVATDMSHWRRMNMNGIISCLFSSKDGTEEEIPYPDAPTTAPAFSAPKPKKRRNRGKKKAGPADDDAMDIDTPDATTFGGTSMQEHTADASQRTEVLVLDGHRLNPLRKGHPILDKLMMNYPGYHCIGEQAPQPDEGGGKTRIGHDETDEREVDDLVDRLDVVDMDDDTILEFLRSDQLLISKNLRSE